MVGLSAEGGIAAGAAGHFGIWLKYDPADFGMTTD